MCGAVILCNHRISKWINKEGKCCQQEQRRTEWRCWSQLDPHFQWWRSGTGFPGKSWVPHLWRCFRRGWMGLWGTWSSRRCPFPQQGRLELDDLQGPLPALPFYESMIFWIKKWVFCWLSSNYIPLLHPYKFNFNFNFLSSSTLRNLNFGH